MRIPVYEALAIGAAQYLLAALKLYVGLRRNGDMAAIADAVANSDDDGMLKAGADELIAL